MDKIIKVGITYIRFSAYLILFLILLYFIIALFNMMSLTFYSAFGIMSYILIQVILPLYLGFLIFFVLYILSEVFKKIFTEKDKEEDA